MTATLNPKAESLLTSMGYKDVNVFVFKQSKKILEEKIKEKQEKIAFYEKKYGMTYEEFIVRVIDKNDPALSKFGIIEKEDDDNDWDDSIDFLEIYQKRLQTVL